MQLNIRLLRLLLAILAVLASVLLLNPAVAGAQQPSTPSTSEQPATSGAAAHYNRMAAAKTVFLKNAGGNEIPFNVISRNFESWSRFILVDSPDKADLVIEIQSPDDGSEKKDKDSGSKTSVSGNQQQRQPSYVPSVPTDMITLTVYDKNKRPMWIGREEPKFAVHHKAEEARLVEAAQKLFTRLHDRIEPPVKP